MPLVTLSAFVGVAFGWLAGYFLTWLALLILSVAVVFGFRALHDPRGGSGNIGALFMFGPATACFLLVGWVTWLFFALSMGDGGTDWRALFSGISSLIFR